MNILRRFYESIKAQCPVITLLSVKEAVFSGPVGIVACVRRKQLSTVGARVLATWMKQGNIHKLCENKKPTVA